MEQLVTITLFGQKYSFKTDITNTKEVVYYLSKEIKKIEASLPEKTGIDQFGKILLAALNITNDLVLLKKAFTQLKQQDLTQSSSFSDTDPLSSNNSFTNQLPSILFICTGNSCRSQMAEAWVRHLRSDQFTPYSAGTVAKNVDPLAIAAMSEVGIDISNHKSKTLDELPEMDYDYVVTVCDHAARSCPIFNATVKLIQHSFDDPPQLAEKETTTEEKLAHYRRVRDEIRTFVEQMPDILKD